MSGRAFLAWAIAVSTLGCTSTPDPRDADDYLRWVSFRSVIGKENVLLRWRAAQMPIKVHVMDPPLDLFEAPEDVHEAVLDGIFNWTDVVEPGVPSFVLVDGPGEADIPIVWEEEPDGDYYIAHCVYDVNIQQRRFGVSRILMTGRWDDGRVAKEEEIYRIMLHEMGHALGIGGHSPNGNDIMGSRGVRWLEKPGITRRDRNTLQRLYEMPIGKRMPGAKRKGY